MGEGIQNQKPVTGGCDCGAVTFRGARASGITTCYCKQCQRHTSYAVAASHMPLDGFEIDDLHGALRWYDSSDFAKRGFCSRCGSSLFWQMFDADGNHARDHISVMAGAIDDTSALTLEKQIYVDGAQGYHRLDPECPASKSTDY